MSSIKTTYISDNEIYLEDSSLYIGTMVNSNDGKRVLSPSDLLASSLSSCNLSIIGKIAQRDGVDLCGTSIEMKVIMNEKLFRAEKFEGKVKFPKHINEKYRIKLLRAAKSCPIHKSLLQI